MSGILLRPMLVAWRRVTLVLGHLVSLLGVWGVRRIRWTRSGYGRIYRYLGVRLYMWCGMMVILVSILQGHGRTCCLSHTDCIGVPCCLRVLRSRNVFRTWELKTDCPPKSDAELAAVDNLAGNCAGRTSLRSFLVQQMMNLTKTLRIESGRPTLAVSVCATLTVWTDRLHFCPSNGAVDAAMSVDVRVADALMMNSRRYHQNCVPSSHERLASLVADSNLASQRPVVFGRMSKLTRQH